MRLFQKPSITPTLTLMVSGLMGMALCCPLKAYTEGCLQTATTTPDMVVCAEADLSRVDGDLSTIFSGLQRYLDPTGKKKLMEAETAWLQYRESQCDFETDTETNGEMKQLFAASCKTKLTQDRIKAMYDHYEFLKRKNTPGHSQPNHPLSEVGGPIK
jgi:uncharacterized protein YecT (DUF1311 family)